MLPAIAALQALLLLILARRLMGGRARRPPERPMVEGIDGSSLTVLVATLNEVERLGPCLDGLIAQGRPVTEILFIDSGSTDGTRVLIEAAAQRDARIKLVTDPPLPVGWIGKAWALQYGATIARNDWLLGMDADTQAEPGCAAAVLTAAQRERMDAVSFAPRFDGQSAAERFIQPALLTTLIYRSGAVGDPHISADRVMANGQCFLVRRDVLLEHGGYEPVRSSFAEDVSLARHLARRGATVGFLDGSRLYRVRSYRGAGQMWREWGRSIDLKDATPRLRQLFDAFFVVAAQGLQLPLILWILLASPRVAERSWGTALIAATAGILFLRLALLIGIAPSYERRGLTWWLSPLADPLAAARLVISSLRRPRQWRSRSYGAQ